MLTLKNLRYALTLAEHRHFGDAARALGVSQPALSRAIGSLETHLGLQLFERNRGGVTPTQGGVHLLRSIQQVVLESEDLERESALLRDIGPHLLRVSLGPYPAVLSGHRAARELLALIPEAQCRIQVAPWQETAEKLHQRKFDLAIVELIPAIEEDSRLVTELLSSNRGAICCREGHPLLARDSITLPPLVEFPWVGTRLPKRIPLRSALGESPVRGVSLDEANGDFVPAIEVDALGEIAPLVAESDALGLVTLTMIEGELESGRLKVLPFQPDWLRVHYGFAHLKRRSLSPTARTYMELVRLIEAEIAQHEAELWRRFGPAAPQTLPRARIS